MYILYMHVHAVIQNSSLYMYSYFLGICIYTDTVDDIAIIFVYGLATVEPFQSGILGQKKLPFFVKYSDIGNVIYKNLHCI